MALMMLRSAIIGGRLILVLIAVDSAGTVYRHLGANEIGRKFARVHSCRRNQRRGEEPEQKAGETEHCRVMYTKER